MAKYQEFCCSWAAVILLWKCSSHCRLMLPEKVNITIPLIFLNVDCVTCQISCSSDFIFSVRLTRNIMSASEFVIAWEVFDPPTPRINVLKELKKIYSSRYIAEKCKIIAGEERKHDGQWSGICVFENVLNSLIVTMPKKIGANACLWVVSLIFPMNLDLPNVFESEDETSLFWHKRLIVQAPCNWLPSQNCSFKWYQKKGVLEGKWETLWV